MAKTMQDRHWIVDGKAVAAFPSGPKGHVHFAALRHG